MPYAGFNNGKLTCWFFDKSEATHTKENSPGEYEYIAEITMEAIEDLMERP